MMIVLLVAVVGTALIVAGVAGRKPRREDPAEWSRLTAPWAPAREDLTDPGIGYRPRHALNDAPGTPAQQHLWNSVTGQFHDLRDQNWSPEEQANLRSVTT